MHSHVISPACCSRSLMQEANVGQVLMKDLAPSPVRHQVSHPRVTPCTWCGPKARLSFTPVTRSLPAVWSKTPPPEPRPPPSARRSSCRRTAVSLTGASPPKAPTPCASPPCRAGGSTWGLGQRHQDRNGRCGHSPPFAPPACGNQGDDRFSVSPERPAGDHQPQPRVAQPLDADEHAVVGNPRRVRPAVITTAAAVTPTLRSCRGPSSTSTGTGIGLDGANLIESRDRDRAGPIQGVTGAAGRWSANVAMHEG